MIDVMVDIGYGRMREASQISGAVGYSGAEARFNEKGKAKFKEAFFKDALNTEINEYYKGRADKNAAPTNQVVNESISNLPILNRLFKSFGEKLLSIEANDCCFTVGDASAVTRTIDNNPKGNPYVLLYRAAFSSHRDLAQIILHEFGHVDSYISLNFNRNYIKNNNSWNKTVYMDEDYAFRFAYKNGGNHWKHPDNWPHYLINYRKAYGKDPD